MDTFFHQSPVTTNTQEEIANLTNERQISSYILTETIKGFNGLMIKSTIDDSIYDDSEEDDAESDPKSDPKSDPLVDTHTSDGNEGKNTDNDTTEGNYPHKLLMNR